MNRNFFIKDRKILMSFLCLIIVCVLSLTIAYAVLSATLNIQGNAEVVASSWDIHLDNIKVSSGSVSGSTPTITSPTTATFSAALTTPGDFYAFTIDVVNDGSIDAMIESVTKTPVLTAKQAKYLNYIIEYEYGDSINTKQLVEKGSFVRLKVRVEFRNDINISDLPTTSETLNLAFTVNYVQSDGTGTLVTNNGMFDPYKIGNEVCFDTECFYIMYSDEETVTMLSKYNLYVGGVHNNGWVAYGDEATGKQDSTMLGVVSAQPFNGTTPFAKTNYWSSTVSSYPTYVYNENSLLYTYVENYKIYLTTLGITPNSARLISYDELINLGCIAENKSCGLAPSWVYSTSYWTGSAHSSEYLWFISISGNFNHNFHYSGTYAYGVRPVIVVSKDQIIN